MDEVSYLINSFKGEKTEELKNLDSSNKDSIIAKLEEFEDKRILPFFLNVLLDEKEYDLARIEVLKILELRNCVNEAEYQKIGQVIKQILVNDPDDDVRNYAAMAISSYMKIDGVIEEVERIILNKENDINLKENAFAAVEKMGSTEQSVALLKKLLQVDEFKESALRVLNEWKVI